MNFLKNFLIFIVVYTATMVTLLTFGLGKQFTGDDNHFTRIEERLDSLQAQNDSLRNEMILLNSYLYD